MRRYGSCPFAARARRLRSPLPCHGPEKRRACLEAGAAKTGQLAQRRDSWAPKNQECPQAAPRFLAPAPTSPRRLWARASFSALDRCAKQRDRRSVLIAVEPDLLANVGDNLRFAWRPHPIKFSVPPNAVCSDRPACLFDRPGWKILEQLARRHDNGDSLVAGLPHLRK